VGIISAMTEHFCDTCNRVRLSSTGRLHTCLAHDDAVDLVGPLRTGGDAAVVETVRAALAVKRDGHLFQLSGLGGPRKPMIAIGG
jgi:cyclic pyranopterin phosphate synthase